MAREIRTFSRDKALVEERRREIILASTKAFVRKGYDRTTTRELANALGMSPGGLYHYVGAKDDILHLILDFNSSNQAARFERIRKAIAALGPTAALEKALQLHMKDVDQYRDMLVFINRVGTNLGADDRRLLGDASRRLVAFYEDVLQKGVDAGEFKADDVHLYAFDIVMITQAWATRRFHFQGYSLDDYIREQTRFIMHKLVDDTGTPSDLEEVHEQNVSIYESHR